MKPESVSHVREGNNRSRRRKKSPLKAVITVLLLVILITSIVVMIRQSREGYDFLANSRYALLRVSGGSMEPELHNGDAVLTKNDAFEDLQTGQVIAFVSEGDLIVHKIVEVRDGALITRGTANQYNDDPVYRENYKARVVCRIPLLGDIWKLYTSVPLFLIWVVLLVLLIFGEEIFSKIYDLIQTARKGQ